MLDAGVPKSSLARSVGWAAYLGISWTWCIGMFLPILLIRDFGWLAFAVFAIPNVIGAAAMGWVLRSPDDVTSIWERHRPAIRLFTWVTILFHCFFLGWIGWVLAPGLSLAGELSMMPIAAGVAILVTGTLVRRNKDLAAAALVWICSLALGALMVNAGGWEAVQHDRSGLFSRAADPSLAFLAPVCIFGFLFCPYLDATFLRARHNLPSPRHAKLAFGIGFGAVFFSMILLTLGYAAALEPGVNTVGEGPRLGIAVLLFAHFVTQAFFTFIVHIRALPGGGPRGVARFAVPLLCIATFVGGLVLGGVHLQSATRYAGISLGEVAYRAFMAFYGLVFPTYVWICMIPTRDSHAGTSGDRGKRKLTVLLASIALATPCYWMGFIERETCWLAPGLGVVLLARLMIRGKVNPPTTAAPTAPR